MGNNSTSSRNQENIKITTDYKPRTYTLEEFKRIFKNGVNTLANEFYEQSKRK